MVNDTGMHRDRLGIVVEGGVDVVDFGAEGHLGGIGERQIHHLTDAHLGQIFLKHFQVAMQVYIVDHCHERSGDIHEAAHTDFYLPNNTTDGRCDRNESGELAC